MNVINIIDRIDKVNFGIWNAALLPCATLYNIYGVKCYAVFPMINDVPDVKSLYNVEPLPIQNTDTESFKPILERFSPSDTFVVSHGSWRFPTRWGHYASQCGFKWVYTPHGMLEPWGMKQKRIKKTIYFHLCEKRLARRAAMVRAVSKPEMLHLNIYFKNVTHIPNGAECKNYSSEVDTLVTVLFLGRLNSKKCVYNILKAWIDSKAFMNQKLFLKIIGPDDGEFARLHSLFSTLPDDKNVYLSNSPVYGQEKEALLAQATYFILPSQSEGFPSAVVEAGMAGCVPVVSDGCNFPEVFENHLGIKVGCDCRSLSDFFDTIVDDNANAVDRGKYSDYFKANYSVDVVARSLYNSFETLLGAK